MVPYAPPVEQTQVNQIVEQKQGPINTKICDTENEAKEFSEKNGGGYISPRYDGKWVVFFGKKE